MKRAGITSRAPFLSPGLSRSISRRCSRAMLTACAVFILKRASTSAWRALIYSRCSHVQKPVHSISKIESPRSFLTALSALAKVACAFLILEHTDLCLGRSAYTCSRPQYCADWQAGHSVKLLILEQPWAAQFHARRVDTLKGRERLGRGSSGKVPIPSNNGVLDPAGLLAESFVA
jgi:hypothetical protein